MPLMVFECLVITESTQDFFQLDKKATSIVQWFYFLTVEAKTVPHCLNFDANLGYLTSSGAHGLFCIGGEVWVHM